MLSNDKKEFSSSLREVMSLYNKKADPDIFSIWWNILEDYSLEEVKYAFIQYAKNEKYPPVPAGVIEFIPSARKISADQAWAHVPKSECKSAYVTEKMMKSLAQAIPLIDAGDMIAARKTFISAYDSLPDDSNWFHTKSVNVCYEDHVSMKIADHQKIESFGWVGKSAEIKKLTEWQDKYELENSGYGDGSDKIKKLLNGALESDEK